MSYNRYDTLRNDVKYMTIEQVHGFIEIITNREDPRRIISQWNDHQYLDYERCDLSTILELEEYVTWCFAETIATALDCVENDFLKYFAQIIIMGWLTRGIARETINNDVNTLDLTMRSDGTSGSFNIFLVS